MIIPMMVRPAPHSCHAKYAVTDDNRIKAPLMKTIIKPLRNRMHIFLISFLHFVENIGQTTKDTYCSY